MAQVRARVERGAELGERPALEQPDLGLGDVAAGELLQQLERRDRLRDLVAARLDIALLAERAREQLELVAADHDARLLELLHRGAKPGAARDLHLHRILADPDRRAEVPRAVAGSRGQGNHQEAEKGL